ncbi:MAG: hypothetical protein K0Q73_7202 [Paenibacillus sp.]|jgi:predicted amidophosphoribosyltransferase|nr:hypothetical protein [Paenibacillus sp.]
MNIISNCCGKSIVQGTKQEHPLNDRFSIGYKTDVCEECGNEADPIEACDCCGEPSEELKETVLGDYCTECLRNEMDNRTEQLKQEWGLGA